MPTGVVAAHVALAAITARIPDIAIRANVAHEQADYFAETNPNFDRGRFMEASGVTTCPRCQGTGEIEVAADDPQDEWAYICTLCSGIGEVAA